jgi:hypothetical protein
MRLEKHRSENLPNRLPKTAFETDLQYNDEGHAFSRQLEIVDQIVDQHRSIAELARRLGVEEQQARYP